MVERQKTEAMIAKRQIAKGVISSSSEEEENYKSDTGDETDLYPADDDENPLQL